MEHPKLTRINNLKPGDKLVCAVKESLGYIEVGDIVYVADNVSVSNSDLDFKAYISRVSHVSDNIETSCICLDSHYFLRYEE